MEQQLKFNILTDVIGSEKIKTLGNQVDSMSSSIVKSAGALYLLDMARKAVTFGIDQAKSIIEFGDQLEALSEKTGIGSQALSGYKAAADQANLSFEGLEKGLKKFSQQLGDPNSKNFNDTLKSIGITSKDSATIMDQLADKFSNMENGPKKAALAVSLFGKAGIDMIPFLNQGADALSRFGIKFSGEFTRNADEFNDTLSISKNLILEQAIAISEKYIPVLTDLGKAWNDVQVANREATNFDNSEVDIKAFAAAVYSTFKELADGIDSIFTHIKTEFIFIKSLNAEAANIMTLGLSSGSGFGNIAKNFGEDWKAGDNSIKQSLDDYKKRTEARKADISNFEESLLKSIDERKAGGKSKKSSSGGAAVALPDAELDAIKKFKAEQMGQIELEKLKANSYLMSNSELEKMTIAQQIHNQASKESIKWSEDSKAKLEAVTAEIIKQRIAIIDQAEAQKASFGNGARVALKSYLETVRDVSKQTEQMFTKAFNNIEDVFVSFIKTGKSDFKAFADAVIDDLIRISVRQATMGIYSSIGSYFSPGSTAAAGGGGGVAGVNLGNPGVSVTPFSVSGKLGGGSQSSSGPVNITVTVNNSGSDLSGDTGSALGSMIASVVKNTIVIEKRPGGLLAS